MNNEILIAGSGPSGVSAAFPLVKAGKKVTLIDVGEVSKYPLPIGNYLSNRYNDENQSNYLIGKNFESLNNNHFDNPKQRVARHSYLFDNFVEENNIQAKNFTPIGTHAQGGLSNIWGATVATFDDLDFKGSIMEDINLSSNYADIIKRIGVSGNLTDDLSEYFGQGHNIQKEPKLDTILNNVLNQYSHKKKIINNEGIKIGRSRNAILTNKLNNRSGCQNCGMCLYGCSIDSIYTANYDLRELIKYSNFEYIPGKILKKIVPSEGKNIANIYDVNQQTIEKIEFKNIILACGPLASTKIVLESLNLYNKKINFLSNPRTFFALFFPKYLGSTFTSDSYNFGQIAYTYKSNSNYFLDSKRNVDAFGVFYNIQGIPLNEFVREKSFLSRITSRRILKYIMPSIRVANCYMPGEFTDHRIMLDENSSLHIEGSFKKEYKLLIKELKKSVSLSFRKFGGFLLPGSFKESVPGSDIHYSGTLKHSNANEIYQTNLYGELNGIKNLFIVDASVLPVLPTKPYTLTIMANADRIGKYISKK